MNEGIKRLAEAIEESKRRFVECSKLLGPGDFMTTAMRHEYEGLEKAFEIVTGERYFDYWMRTIN